MSEITLKKCLDEITELKTEEDRVLTKYAFISEHFSEIHGILNSHLKINDKHKEQDNERLAKIRKILEKSEQQIGKAIGSGILYDKIAKKEDKCEKIEDKLKNKTKKNRK